MDQLLLYWSDGAGQPPFAFTDSASSRSISHCGNQSPTPSSCCIPRTNRRGTPPACRARRRFTTLARRDRGGDCAAGDPSPASPQVARAPRPGITSGRKQGRCRRPRAGRDSDGRRHYADRSCATDDVRFLRRRRPGRGRDRGGRRRAAANRPRGAAAPRRRAAQARRRRRRARRASRSTTPAR